MMSTTYCKIYVGIDISRGDLKSYLLSKLGLCRVGQALCGTGLEIDVRRNEDHEPEKYSPAWDGFVYSRYYLDVDSAENVSRESYISSVRSLLRVLKEMGGDVVAACDFESELQ